MNLDLTRRLLAAADEQPHGFLRVSGRDETREVELLVRAGFVEASLETNEMKTTAIISRVTDSGHKLLRVLRQNPSSLN